MTCAVCGVEAVGSTAVPGRSDASRLNRLSALARSFTDGGCAPALVPQDDGRVPRVCASVPPRATSLQSSQVRAQVPAVQRGPLDVPVGVADARRGDRSVPPCRLLYAPIRIVAASNCGLETVRKFAPFIVG